MKKHLLLMLGALIALPTLARDFEYTYEGKTLTYTVIDETAKTVETKAGVRSESNYNAGNNVTGKLILPSTVYDGTTKYTLVSIGAYAFYFCMGLTSVDIPNSVSEICERAFCGCSGLTSISIPNSVTEIGSSAFYDCSGLTSVNIPNSVTKISGWAFSGCSSLTSVYIPDSVTEILSGTFNGCSNLASVVIPNYVSTIDNDAFSGCSSLTSVYIPNSVITINTRAFCRCSGLTSVTYLAEEPVFRKSRIFDDETYQKATLNYLKSAEEKIAATEPWSLFVNRIGRDADWKEEGAISEVHATDCGATAVYDMRGVKVGESTEGLPKGIYIVREGGKSRKVAL